MFQWGNMGQKYCRGFTVCLLYNPDTPPAIWLRRKYFIGTNENFSPWLNSSSRGAVTRAVTVAKVKG